ncbi:hypothetical protein GCM10020218_042180 [Dactylosporangium vinaceum]
MHVGLLLIWHSPMLFGPVPAARAAVRPRAQPGRRGDHPDDADQDEQEHERDAAARHSGAEDCAHTGGR